MGIDLYKILGVSPTASQSEIKKAYKRLAKILHPDAHRGASEYEEKFKQLSNAYQILKKPTSRQSYDNTHFNNFTQPNWKRDEDSAKKSKKSSSEFWTKGRNESQNSSNSEKREDSRADTDSVKSDSYEDSSAQKRYREPWGGIEPITFLKSIVVLTLISMIGIGVRHSSSQFAKPQKSIVFDKDISEDKEVKDHEQIPFNPSKGSKHSHKNPANIPLEKSEYDGHSNHDDSLNENTASEVESVEEITAENAKIARQANPSREELALFDEMIACVQQRNYLDCYDLATTATETFIDRSRLGTAYFVQFISAYNIDKSDASLDLFFVMQELQNLGQIHIDPLYEAQAYRSALHLTVILNNKLNYYALRDLAITHTESYAEYAEQVDDIIKSADAKSWTSQ